MNYNLEKRREMKRLLLEKEKMLYQLEAVMTREETSSGTYHGTNNHFVFPKINPKCNFRMWIHNAMLRARDKVYLYLIYMLIWEKRNILFCLN